MSGKRGSIPALAIHIMASNSFRDSMNSLGWSRRDPDLPVNTSTSTPILSRLQSLNPFSDGGYVRLPTSNEGPGAPLPAPTRREEEEGFFACKSSLGSNSVRCGCKRKKGGGCSGLRHSAVDARSLDELEKAPVPASFLARGGLYLAAFRMLMIHGLWGS